ncbi:MAG: 4-hydroxy-tetrahydrodipicolinate reductase, partial [Lachnospiraceae bacterium]|nr:4-hydroxy-tetrahydrodipicolinate reductase [Lachnospiraceae bacterium]
MVKILLVGCLGRMGRILTDLASSSDSILIAEGVDQYAGSAKDTGYPVRKSLAECDQEADVLVDFSNAGALEEILAHITGRNMPAVLCATGYSREQLDE